jgi:hypothetical protein
MRVPTQHGLIEKLADIHRFSPDVRFGQLLANIGFLVEDQTDRPCGKSMTLASWRSWRSSGSICCDGKQAMAGQARGAFDPTQRVPFMRVQRRPALLHLARVECLG